MSRLTATPTTVIRVLERLGWQLDHTRGSHRYFRHPNRPGLVTVPVHGRDLKPKTLHSIMKQAGISRAEFLRLR